MKFIVATLFCTGLALTFYQKHGWILSEADLALNGPKTISERVEQYGSVVSARLKPDFDKAGVAYPPAQVTLVILKEERRLEVYAQGSASGSSSRFIRAYPILAASGTLGPKLREGDGQVPEGIYAVDSLNPNSHYHLALHVDYPNAFDRANARNDGRTQLGGDIMIHGSDVSIGCVAMGDPTAEDLFVLTSQTGLRNVRLIFSPYDFRAGTKPVDPSLPAWTGKLYEDLQKNLAKLPAPPRDSKT